MSAATESVASGQPTRRIALTPSPPLGFAALCRASRPISFSDGVFSLSPLSPFSLFRFSPSRFHFAPILPVSCAGGSLRAKARLDGRPRSGEGAARAAKGLEIRRIGAI